MKKSLFLEFVGDSSLARILDVFIDELDMDVSKKDIAERTEMSRTTVFKYWPELEKLNVVTETRRFGKTKLYTLNRESPIVQKLLALESELISVQFIPASVKTLISFQLIPATDKS